MYKIREFMVSLDNLPPEARELVESLQAEVARLNRVSALYQEEIRLLNIRFFGPKAEKLSPNQIELLLEEASTTAAEVEKEADRPEAEKVITPTPSRKARAAHPGREKLPEHLERREEIIACHPKDCVCSQCGAPRPVIAYEVKETLMCKPAEFWVQVTKREKRGSHCVEEEGVATAAAPAEIVPKGKLSNEFIIEVLAKKYQQHLPVYRQCAWMADNFGIELSRKTVTDAIMTAAWLLVPVVREQARVILAGEYLQADETTMPCQTQEKTGKNHRAYMWEYSQPGGLVVFDFQMGRGRDGPREFLKTFKGVLQADGYGGYDDLGEGITYAGCMAHLRRGFVDASKLAPNDPAPVEIISHIAKLYAVEEEARAASLSREDRRALRQRKSVPLMSELKTRIVELRHKLMPGGKLAAACDYAINQWPRMEVFLSNGLVEIDNNWCEGAMRPLALGRKNWLHVGSPDAGPKVAAIASIAETCRRLKINLRDYLGDVLPKLADPATPTSELPKLTPSAWLKSRSAA